MTDSITDTRGDGGALEAASARLDHALERLEAGLSNIAARAPAPEASGGGSPEREAALEAALGEASQTLGALIAETRAAIQEAEAAAAAKDGADGAG